MTLLHRTTTARRITGGLLVSHASRFSIGCRLPAFGRLTCSAATAATVRDMFCISS